MADINYDTLNIVIEANSSNAQKSVRALTKNLNALDETAKSIDKERILEVKELLLDISNIDFSNVSQGLKDVVSAFKSIERFGTKYEKIKSTKNGYANALNMGSVVQSIQPQANAFGFDVASSLKEYQNQMATINKSANKLLGDVFKVQNAFKPIVIDSQSLNDELEKASKENKEIAKSQKKINDEIKKSASGFSKITKQFLNIAKYRLVRKLIQEIFNQITTAMQQLAEHDKDFDKSLGEIKSAFSYIGRTLITAIAPIIKEIAPLFTILAQSVGQVLTAIGESLANGLGQEQFVEAKESVESYTDSLKKAKNVATGIDELNVISQEKDDDLFATKDLETNSEGFAKVFENLKPVIDKLTKEILSIVDALFDFLDEARPILEIIWELVKDTLELTSESVNGSIKDTLIALGSILNLLTPIIILLKPILDILNYINALLVNIINWSISLLVNSLTTIFDYWSAIGKTIVAFLTGDFDAIGEIWNNLLMKMYNVWGDFGKNVANFFIQIWNRVVGFIQDSINNLIDGINRVGKYFGWNVGKVDFSGAMGQTFASGGFPQEDGLFFANHTELIGQFSNGQTAVANNEQIVEGIKQGVLEAMLESNSGGNINVLIDGYEVASIVEKRQNNSGMTLVYGGNINYGK